jgi:hypothetical protein
MGVKMKKSILLKCFWIVAALIMIISSGCETKKQTGALAGAGVGALIGQGIGGNTTGTLIGAGVGTGVGYLIGNEMDKKDAKSRKHDTPEETMPFANTSWQLVSISPEPEKNFKSMTIHFKPDGTVVTTRVFPDNSVHTSTERYRVVGQTLILNQNDYLINANFKIQGDQLTATSDKYTTVFKRINM